MPVAVIATVLIFAFWWDGDTDKKPMRRWMAKHFFWWYVPYLFVTTFIPMAILFWVLSEIRF